MIEVADDALRTQPYTQVQMRDLAAAAGVALATLYRYFPSKESLYLEVLQVWSAEHRTEIDDTDGSPVERIRHRVALVLDAFTARPELFVLQQVLTASPDPQIRAGIADYQQVNASWASRELSAIGGDDGPLIVEMYWAVLTSAMSSPTTRRRVVERFLDLIAPLLHEAG